MKLEEYLDKWIKGESEEVTWYLAAAVVAEERGLIEVAQALKTIAMEEAMHGARALIQAGKIPDLRKFIEVRIEAEKKAAEERHEEAKHHDEPWKTLFEYTARDEERHAKMLDRILKRIQ
ncbi:MAG: rubrerythrin family protein [Thermoprotei archaeon]|nr:MAG: rubrerythrin family protein [Thermoprotei archaeon]